MDNLVRKIILSLVVNVGLVYCEPPLNTQYGVPGNYAGGGNGHGTLTNSYGTPVGGGHDENQDYIDNQPKSYEFGYAVKDEATGNDFGRRETSDGETVRGEYRVQLPDGRTQIVTYTADWRTGFHADVRYEGVATYPDQYNTNNNGYNNNAPSGYDYPGNNIDNSYNTGNNAGYNNYQNGGGNYNAGPNYNYQYGSNSVDNNYNSNNFNSYAGYSSNSFGSGSPTPTYGTPAYH
ncbi:pro-resilin-like [Leptopilina heterotoma]|uniref:pro-resilin-like n=1 Tax=Leptopilina heterotoma TaxID=63436 RepID=UPI001CA8CD7E|nr:pro-resilin-like [Leptopilina heterotoma]